MPMGANQAETLARIGTHQAPSLPRQAPETPEAATPEAATPTLPAPG
jgi:hypothetical protein